MKHEYKKHEKELYNPKNECQLLIVPKQKFFCIKGVGNPNNDDFKNRIGILYSLSYTIKMMPKKGIIPEGYYEYTVYPLEGTWDLTEKGRQNINLDKDELIYTIMIRQPEFVTKELAQTAINFVKKKNNDPLVNEVYFDEIEDGLSVQIMHLGSYDTEPESFAKMKNFINENGYKIKTLVHREIYLSDARKVSSDKLKTILRYQIEKAND